MLENKNKQTKTKKYSGIWYINDGDERLQIIGFINQHPDNYYCNKINIFNKKKKKKTECMIEIKYVWQYGYKTF